MAATEYTYSIQSDFPDQKVNPVLLKQEIDNCPISTALERINEDGDDCNIWFADALSSGDKTTLDGIIAAHQGTETTSEPQHAADGGISFTDQTDWQEKLKLTTQPLSKGTYQIVWYCETRLNNGGLGDYVRTRLAAGGFDITEDNWHDPNWHGCSGFAIIDFWEATVIDLTIDYKVFGSGGDTAYIKQARISIIKLCGN